MDFYKGTIPIIDDSPAGRDLMNPRGVGKGYVPRDFNEYPREMFAPPSEMTVYSESDWDALYDEQEAKKSSLEHLYLSGPGGGPAFVNLDQHSDGYCWGYSNGHAAMMARLVANQPIVRLNPHAVCAIIKRGRNEGGWCGLAAKFLREVGIPSDKFWPGWSRDLRHDTPAMRQNAALHRTTEDYVDLTAHVAEQTMATRQIATCLFDNVPVPCDFNHAAHSVCGIRWVRVERGSWGLLYLNSWKGWGHHGLGVFRGSKARADGAVALRVTGGSPV